MFKSCFVKSIAGILVSVSVPVFMAGCGQLQKEGLVKNENNDVYVYENSFPIVKNPITIKILKPLIINDTEYGKTQVIQEYETKTNIHVEWILPLAAEFNDRYHLIMASGDLPDAVIACPPEDIESKGQQGAFVALNELIRQHMPNLGKVLEEFPEAKKTITGKDGLIFSMPFIYRYPSGNNVLLIREDWLLKLGLRMPVTTGDWYEVLKAFKDQDPNGNGKADEIPYSGDGIRDLRSLVSAWGLHDDGEEAVFYLAEKLFPQDGKIHFSPMESRYKEAVEWFAKLYREGLVDAEIITNDDVAYKMKMEKDLLGATRGYFGHDLSELNRTAAGKGDTGFHLVGAPVMKGPYEDQWHTFVDPSALPQGMVITCSNKYPAETARWADYWYGAEGQRLMYGYEGKHYTMVNGVPQWTEYVTNNPEGIPGPKVWGSVTPGRSIWPTVWVPKELIIQGDSPETREAKKTVLKPEYMVEPLPLGLSFSQKDNERRKQLMADIMPFVHDAIIQFVIGQKPLSEWDDYVSHIQAMGIEEVLEIYEKAYGERKVK